MPFSIQSSLRYGWEAFKQRSRLYLVSSLIFFVLLFAVGIVATLIDDTVNESLTSNKSLPGTLVDLGLSTVLNMGVTAFYLKAFDTPEVVNVADLWHPQRFWSYLFVSLISALSVVVGLLFFIVPGVIMGLMYLFGTFVVIDRGYGTIAALEESRRITKGHRWQLFWFMCILALINLLGLLVLGIGLLVTFPVTVLAFVYVYQALLDAAGPSPYERVVENSELRLEN